MAPNAENSGESTEVTKIVETKVPMEMVQLLVEQGMTEVPQQDVRLGSTLSVENACSNNVNISLLQPSSFQFESSVTVPSIAKPWTT